ncbi:MAG: hypothetical protein H7235_08605 [Bdellovibrionaceae bacterium]|nr:hypothetical protein [Pseudobdellovibrionaceae bacterium]
MKKIIILTLSFQFFAFADTTKNFESAGKLGEYWHNEEVYFIPKNKNEVMNWSGVIYFYPTKKCYELNQKDIPSKVVARETKCNSSILKKATEPYTIISEFEQYKSQLLKCLNQSDEKCIRGLVSKTLQVSFGVDGMLDRRDYIFENWKKEDFKRLHDLIKKGTIGEGDSRTFPPVIENEGMGYRGQFKKENDSWLLKYFLAGD